MEAIYRRTLAYQKEKRPANRTVISFLSNKRAMAGVIIVLLVVIAVVFLPAWLKLDPNRMDLEAGFSAKPSLKYPLGTDEVGRDAFARLLYGGRVSLMVGFSATILSILVGLPLGLIAGFYGKFAAQLVLRAADVFMSFPSMILILVLVSVLGPSITTVTFVIGIMGWTSIAKYIYGNVITIKHKEYVEAARAGGASNFYILFKEILPNAIAPVWATLSFKVSGAILTESGLSFLGLGVQTPQASWGNIISSAQKMIVLTARPWIWIPPGICILLMVMAFNFIGEGIRDALDPKIAK